MAKRTPEQQAQFDAAELVNKSRDARPAADKVTLEVQNVKSKSKSTKVGDK